ncbi:LOW QUALITY PROTEIN: tetratricopeptide repeat protein, partial [Bacteroides sp. 3_1_33FAA]
MKKTIGIKRNSIIIIISILLSACTKKENASQQALLLELVQAEAVMYEHPDSALGVLQGMKVPASSDKLQNATWALLTVQAKYKNYKEELADSTLINIAYDYFMKQDNPQRKAMVLYYKGVLYEKADKKNEAQESYLKAIEEAEKTKDYQLAHLIYSSIGNIYLYNSLNEYALQMFKQSLHYAQLSETKNYICSAYYYLGKVYSVLFNFDNSIKHYKKAIQMADTLHNYNVLINGTNQLAGVYTKTKDYQPALSYAQKALRLKETIELPLEKGLEQSYLVIGDIYRHIDKTDSAYYYLNKALAADRIETVCAAYQDLYHLSKKKKDYEKMSQYCDSMIVYQDSIEILNRNKELMDMQEKYNQQKLLNEKNQLKIENNTIIRNVLIILVVVFCLIAILIYIYQRKLIRKEHIIQRN